MRQCGNVLRNARKWTLFFMLSFPDHHSENTEVAHVGLFAIVASNCQTSSSHFLCIPFILGGRHQLSTLTLFSLDPLFSLSIWLSLVHFLLRLPAPDPVGSASAGSRQVGIRVGGVQPLMCYQWQVSVMRTEDCQYLLIFLFLFVDLFFFIITFWSMQILDGASCSRMLERKKWLCFTTVWLWMRTPRKAGVMFTSNPHSVETYAILSQWVKKVCYNSHWKLLCPPPHRLTTRSSQSE